MTVETCCGCGAVAGHCASEREIAPAKLRALVEGAQIALRRAGRATA